jgi:alpha-1,3-mannosyltransferase
MQEVKGYLDGERNYLHLQGDTGPLVYPAGFVYIFSALYHLTNNGVNIPIAQGYFVILYILNLAVVIYVYLQSRKVPWWTITFLVLSKRIHSIFMLRMFNDCIAVFLGYVAMTLFLKHRFRLGCLMYSLAVSVKMNMLLQAPGVLLVLLLATGLQETFVCLSICAVVQLVLGLPFLTTFPLEYLQRAFDLGRVFMHKWTVNFKFLDEEIFISKWLSIALLLLTVAAFAAFGFKWIVEVSKAPCFKT